MRFSIVLLALSARLAMPAWAAESDKAAGALPPGTIEVQATFVRFPTAELEARARKSDAAAVTDEEVLALWAKGRGTLVSGAKIVAPPGATAETKQVHEISYAGGFARASDTNALAPELELRDFGTIVKVTPRRADGVITLELEAELTELAQWEETEVKVELAGRRTARFRAKTPIFRLAVAKTTLSTRDGETVILGLGSDFESKQTLYLFVHTVCPR